MTIYEQLKEIEGKREYVREVLKAGGLAAWEAKEYSNLEIQYTETIAVRLAKRQVEKLKEIIEATGWDKSEVIRRLIDNAEVEPATIVTGTVKKADALVVGAM